MAETDHAPRHNTRTRQFIAAGLMGAGALTLTASSIDPAPKPIASFEQATPSDVGPIDIYAAKTDPTLAQAALTRTQNASRSKNQSPTPSAECWNGSIGDLSHVPKSREKVALANIALACEVVKDEKWFKKSPQQQMGCLVILWDRESGWYQKSGKPQKAYGIPQALPGNKMATIGKDWQTNPETQIEWGADYIDGRYGTPCDALKHHDDHNWY